MPFSGFRDAALGTIGITLFVFLLLLVSFSFDHRFVITDVEHHVAMSWC